MSPPLRFVCHGAVTLWLMAALAWSALPERHPAARPAPDAEPATLTARIQPRPEPPPQAQRDPEPESPPEPVEEPPKSPPPEPEPPPPRLTRVRAADLAAGRALLDGAGAFPALSCSYESFASFRDYAHAMASLGARFVVVRNRQILGAVDVETGAVGEAAVGTGYSPRARDYTGEPALADLALAARGRFGRGAVVMMLVPREIDAGLFGGISRALGERGMRHADYREIRGRYERGPGGGVVLRIDSGVRNDGETVPLSLLFDLGEIARRAGSRA